MSPPVLRLAAAEAEAAAARQRLDRDLSELQARLDPKLLARNVAEQGREVGRVGVDSARRNPALVAAGATVVAALLLRRPIARLFRRRHRVYATPKSSS